MKRHDSRLTLRRVGARGARRRTGGHGGAAARRCRACRCTRRRWWPTEQAIERVAVESRITPGAPYAADAVTESVQVLSDGNRIARKTTTRIYRDSEGRTRREQLSPTGDVQSVSISDPVAGSTYVLNPAAKTAHRNGVIMTSPTGVATAGVASGSSGTVTALRTPDGGTRVMTSEASAEAARQREVETQAVTAAAAGGGRGRSTVGHHAAGPSSLRQKALRSLAAWPRVGSPPGAERSTRKISAAGHRGRHRHGHAHDDDDCRRVDRQRAADPDRVRAVVLGGSEGARHDEAQRSAQRRDDLSL